MKTATGGAAGEAEGSPLPILAMDEGAVPWPWTA